jgi:hypothetical protein
MESPTIEHHDHRVHRFAVDPVMLGKATCQAEALRHFNPMEIGSAERISREFVPAITTPVSN